MAHNYTTGQFTQEDCDEYNTTWTAKCQERLNLFNNVSGTYGIRPVTGIDADGNSIVDPTPVDVVLSAGLSTLLSDWRTANPTADGTSGTDIEKGEYSRWNHWANVQDMTALITQKEEDLAACQACHAEMLATVE